ncbi:hypothetical protein [Vibrio vulnificus]|uniref:hypothetical protein n=1 Tax=Vibrio vulnificus TaxID=672 RepID=UPI0035C87BEE
MAFLLCGEFWWLKWSAGSWFRRHSPLNAALCNNEELESGNQMRKISRSSFLHKIILPNAIAFGTLLIFIVMLPSLTENSANLVFLMLFIVSGFVLKRYFKNTVLDEVYDCGNHLKVWNNSEFYIIDFKDIVHARYITRASGQYTVNLLLRDGTFSGKSVNFIAKRSKGFINKKHKGVTDFIERIDKVKFHGLG